MIYKSLIENDLFFKGKPCWFLSRLDHIKAQVLPVFILCNNLHKLLKPSSDVVSIWKLRVLALDLFTLVKAHRLISPHLRVHRISVLVSPEKKVNVMAPCPPDRRSLSVEYRNWQETEKVIPSLILLYYFRVFIFKFIQILPLLLFINLYQALNSVKELQSLCPWS